jgi:hypothetical protein
MERKKAIGEAVQGRAINGVRRNKLEFGSRSNGRAPVASHKMRFPQISGRRHAIKLLALLGLLICAGSYVYSNFIRQEIRQLVSESSAWQRKNLELQQKIDSLDYAQTRLSKDNEALSEKLDSLKLGHAKKLW